MKTIVHKIRLKPGVRAETFEAWVTQKDYAAADELPSVLSFSVHRVGPPEAPGPHYFEIIRISSDAAFEVDMKTPLFASLVEAFDRMAEVVDEVGGELLEPGYRYV